MKENVYSIKFLEDIIRKPRQKEQHISLRLVISASWIEKYNAKFIASVRKILLEKVVCSLLFIVATLLLPVTL